MTKYLVTGLFIGLFIACQFEDQMPLQVGQLTTVKDNQSSYLDIEKVSTVREFNLIYQKESRGDSSLQVLLPYDFSKKEIEPHYRAKAGIPIIGISLECKVNCCQFSDVLIEVASNQMHQIESEPLDKASLSKWVKLQILNNGLDPALSDNPQNAVFRLAFGQEQPLSDANLLIFQIVEAYEKFLVNRSMEEELDVEKLKEKYPLNLRLAIKPPPKPTFSSEEEDEIMGEITLDLNELDGGI